MAGPTLVVDVWTDVMCPFCYLGNTLLTRAVEEFEHRASVRIRHHSYQLMPHLSADRTTDRTELLTRELGLPRDRIEALNARIAAQGAALGLDYRFDHVLATNTHAAHQLTHFADAAGRQHEMVQRLFRAYFTDGHDIGDHDVLAGLAADVGLDRDSALQALHSDAFAGDVDADIARARQLGITGVPTYVFAGTYLVSGAQPVEALRQALDTTWAALTSPAEVEATG